MDSLINLIYVDGNPMLTAVKLIIVCMAVEVVAVISGGIGGLR